MQNFSEWRQLNNTTAKTLVSIGSTHLHVHVAVPWRRGGSYGIFIRFQLLNWNTFASQQRCIKYNLLPKTLSHSQRIAKKKNSISHRLTNSKSNELPWSLGNLWLHDINHTKREKTDCWLFCSKQTLREPRNGVTDWSIAQLLTEHWLVRCEIASNKNSHASQTTANNSQRSSNLNNKTFTDIVQKETAVNFLKGNEFKAILPASTKVKFFKLFMFYL